MYLISITKDFEECENQILIFLLLIQKFSSLLDELYLLFPDYVQTLDDLLFIDGGSLFNRDIFQGLSQELGQGREFHSLCFYKKYQWILLVKFK